MRAESEPETLAASRHAPVHPWSLLTSWRLWSPPLISCGFSLGFRHSQRVIYTKPGNWSDVPEFPNPVWVVEVVREAGEASTGQLRGRLGFGKPNAWVGTWFLLHGDTLNAQFYPY